GSASEGSWPLTRRPSPVARRPSLVARRRRAAAPRLRFGLVCLAITRDCASRKSAALTPLCYQRYNPARLAGLTPLATDPCRRDCQLIARTFSAKSSLERDCHGHDPC